MLMKLTPEENHDSGAERLKIDMPVVLRVRIEPNVTKNLKNKQK